MPLHHVCRPGLWEIQHGVGDALSFGSMTIFFLGVVIGLGFAAQTDIPVLLSGGIGHSTTLLQQAVKRDPLTAAIGFTADRHAVTGIEVVIQNRDETRWPAVACLNRYVVITGADNAFRYRYIGCCSRIDTVGITRIRWRINNNSPHRDPLYLIQHQMKVRRVD